MEDLHLPFDVTKECRIVTYQVEDRKKLPLRPNDSHKGTFGKVLVIAGSPAINGAAYLAGAAVYRMGAGLVKLYTPKENRIAMQMLLPEALLEIYDREYPVKQQLIQAVKWADVIVIGPGLGMDAEAEKILEYVICESEVPIVIDADGLNLLAKNWRNFITHKSIKNTACLLSINKFIVYWSWILNCIVNCFFTDFIICYSVCFSWVDI